MLWLSLLEYFKSYGEENVIFVTDDKSAFGNHREALTNEFNQVTKKTIEIHPNSYYKEILAQIQTPEHQAENESILEPDELPNLETFRTEVEDAIEGLRCVEYENYFGDPQWSRTFTTSVPFDKDYAKTFFAGLRSDISSHIFERSVPATRILDLDGRLVDADAEIPLKNLENALSIYQRVLSNYSQYSGQFFEAAAKILNRNYIEPKSIMDLDEDNLPF